MEPVNTASHRLEEILRLTEDHVLHTYNRTPLAFERGEGAVLYDIDGGAYLDFTSGIGVNALGYGHPAVAARIRELADGVMHTSNLYLIPSQARLAAKLCAASFGERVFFCNSGTEAVEAALKFARKRGKGIAADKIGIVAFANSFHGRTCGALSVTRQDKYRVPFEPLLEHVTEAPFNDIEAARKAITDSIAAVIVEPVQGEGGVRIATPGFLQTLAEACRVHDALLIVDEVQCGMGRTGRLFAHEESGIVPDIMALAKPLAGGLPIGVAVLGPRAWPSVAPGDHASTFGGNPFVTGVAETVFDIIAAPSFLAHVRETGLYLVGRLKELAIRHADIVDVRGQGLLVGVEMTFPVQEAVAWFREQGVLACLAGPNVLRFIPPLVVTDAECDRAADLLDRYLTERKP